jgi:hypothetical protein
MRVVWHCLFGILLLATPDVLHGSLQAAEAKCETVRESAKTFYPSRLTASVTEDNSNNCSVSVDGASAGSRSANQEVFSAYVCMNSILLNRGFNFLDQSQLPYVAENFIPFIAGLSYPDFDPGAFASPGPPENMDVRGCLSWLQQIAANNTRFSNVIQDGLDSSDFAVIQRCLTGEPSSSDRTQCFVENDRFVIRMSSPVGRHLVYLPQN